MAELKFIGGDSDSTWAARVKIHKDALMMCNRERSIFGKTV
jgi:hypothetical protein